MIFITRLVLWKYRVRFPGFELPEALLPAQEEFDERLAKALEGMADRTEGNGSTQEEDLTSAYTRLEQATRSVSASEHRFTPQILSFLLLSRRLTFLTDRLRGEF